MLLYIKKIRTIVTINLRNSVYILSSRGYIKGNENPQLLAGYSVYVLNNNIDTIYVQ